MIEDGYKSGFVIPAEIPSQNETEKGRTRNARWAKTKARRNLWRLLCAAGMVKGGVRLATGPRKIHIVSYRRKRCRDIANVIGGAKSCVDGMVDAGLLLDDSDIDGKALITYEQDVASKSPTKKPCTVVYVGDIHA